MREFRFREWQVYSDSQDLFSVVLKVTRGFPKEYRYSLVDQIVRSSLSIVLNIAEGSGKSSDAELRRFLDIAIGSAYETVAAIDTCQRNDLITIGIAKDIERRLMSICRQLGGLKRSTKKT